MAQRSPTDIQQRTFDFGVRVIRLVDKLPRTFFICHCSLP